MQRCSNSLILLVLHMSHSDAFQYYIIHKPFKVLSQFTDEDNNPGLGRFFNVPKDVYPVGRLDLDSEGLLLLTNDKRLNHQLLNPKFKHVRTYWAEVEGVPEQSSLDTFSSGLVIKAKGKTYRTAPAKIQIISKVELPERDPSVNRVKHPITSWMEITITEGKNRQVRKMTAAIGHPTLRLVRVGIEGLSLAGLTAGDIQSLPADLVYDKLGIKKKPLFKKGFKG